MKIERFGYSPSHNKNMSHKSEKILIIIIMYIKGKKSVIHLHILKICVIKNKKNNCNIKY